MRAISKTPGFYHPAGLTNGGGRVIGQKCFGSKGVARPDAEPFAVFARPYAKPFWRIA
jgi:hypothetical protein